MRQFHVDSGQIGGLIQIITQSNFIFNMLNFVGVWTLFYDRFLKVYIPIYYGMIIIISGVIAWWCIYYSIVYPSLIQYTNRQSWKHRNPIKKEFDDMNERLDKIEKLMEEKL